MSNWKEEVKNKKNQFYEKCKLANLLKIPQCSVPFCSPQVRPPIQAGKNNKAYLLKINLKPPNFSNYSIV